jgi:hypothetical protein
VDAVRRLARGESIQLSSLVAQVAEADDASRVLDLVHTLTADGLLAVDDATELVRLAD